MSSWRIKLADRLNRVEAPQLFSLPQFDIAEPATMDIVFVPLEPAAVYLERMLSEYGAIDLDVGLQAPVVIEISDLKLLLSADGTPGFEVLNLFEPLLRPRLAGKPYDSSNAKRDETPKQGRLPGELNKEVGPIARCRHGLLRRDCSICNQAQQASKQPQIATFDVFDQLYYILQPPILERLERPDVFPDGRKPYQFQIEGIKWLVDHPNALLADEMGLGKTVQAIVAMRVLFRRGEVRKALIVAPVSILTNWERELDGWAPELKPLLIQGTPEIRTEQWATPADVLLVSHETLARDYEQLTLRPKTIDLVIIDEAQKIKNPTTDRAKAAKSMSQVAKYRWALTGTPLENSIGDTISILEFVSPGANLNSEMGVSELRRTMKPLVLRRTKKMVDVQFPEIRHEEVWLDLSASQRANYQKAEAEGIQNLRALGNEASRVHVFALITKLKKICNYDDDSGQSSKLEYLQDNLPELVANDEKALVFSQYPNVTLRKLLPKLADYNPSLFEGSLSLSERDQKVRNFQNDDTTKLMLMGVHSGGTGLTLTRANHVFHFDHWWNPAVVDQATARIHRIGQERTVFVTSLYTSRTIEARVDKLLKQKRELFRSVFGELEDEKVLEKLSDEDLFGLFGLEVPGSREQTKMFSGTPEEFEQLIQKLFSAMGYIVKVTQRTRDGGIDLEGRAQGIAAGKVAIQCKRYKDSVSVEKVREFWGVIAESSVSQGFMVTTSDFTDPAKRFARDRGRLRLIAGVELATLLRRYKLA
jgi:superfamily II DNA or RNA helicase